MPHPILRLCTVYTGYFGPESAPRPASFSIPGKQQQLKYSLYQRGLKTFLSWFVFIFFMLHLTPCMSKTKRFFNVRLYRFIFLVLVVERAVIVCILKPE